MPRGVYQRGKKGAKEESAETQSPISRALAESPQYAVDDTATTAQAIYNGTNSALKISYDQAHALVNRLGREENVAELERIVGSKLTSEKPTTNGRRGSRKPELTPEVYKDALSAGKTRGDLEANYSFHGRRLGAYARHWGKLKKE